MQFSTIDNWSGDFNKFKTELCGGDISLAETASMSFYGVKKYGGIFKLKKNMKQ